MDDLDTLPLKDDTDVSQEEKNVMNKYFNKNNSSKKSIFTKQSFFLAASCTLLFAFLGNTWVDGVICKLPYCGNPIATLGIKSLIFFVVFFVILKFLN